MDSEQDRTIARNMLNEPHMLITRVDKTSSEPVVMMRGMTAKRLRSLACWCLDNADRQQNLFVGPYHREGLRTFTPKSAEEVKA